MLSSAIRNMPRSASLGIFPFESEQTSNQMNSKPSVKVSVKPSVRGYVLSTLRKVESSDKTIANIGEIMYF